MARYSKCLVIDTDVARSAGGITAQDGKSKGCRDFLLIMQRDTKHKVVTTTAIRAEWQKHQSTFMKTWFASMIAKRRICWIDISTEDELHQKIACLTTLEKKRDTMLKDIHLVEAAYKADKIVISMDETVRRCFHETASAINTLKQIAWINPCKNEDTPLQWLQEGAIVEKERLLGYHKKDSTV